MTTGDEEAENLVDDLFREVDDQFKDLERQYSQAREELATADSERQATSGDALEASNERFALQSQVATLEADLARRVDELDERDRMLAELSDKVAVFERATTERKQMLDELHDAKHSALEERREHARLAALLNARAAEREELAKVASRLQNERDNTQELLTTALARFDEVDAVRIQMGEKLRRLETASDTVAREHNDRSHELIESRAEMAKLTEQVDELSSTGADAKVRADKAEALAERRGNEAGYLNRRIDAMTDKLAEADALGAELVDLRRKLTLGERRNTALDRQIATLQGEVAAANAAVDALAQRTSDREELVARLEQLTEGRDAERDGAPGYRPVTSAEAVETVESDASEVSEVTELADRARELGARRANEADAAATSTTASALEADQADSDAEDLDDLVDLDDSDVSEIESDLAKLVVEYGEPTGEIEVMPADGIVVDLIDAQELPPPPAAPSSLDVEAPETLEELPRRQMSPPWKTSLPKICCRLPRSSGMHLPRICRRPMLSLLMTRVIPRTRPLMSCLLRLPPLLPQTKPQSQRRSRNLKRYRT